MEEFMGVEEEFVREDGIEASLNLTVSVMMELTDVLQRFWEDKGLEDFEADIEAIIEDLRKHETFLEKVLELRKKAGKN